MTQKTTLEKTIAFLRKKSHTLIKKTALEMMGKSEDEIHIILDRAMTDFCNVGAKYFVREYNKNMQKSKDL